MYFPDGLIDLDKGSWSQQRVEHVVGETDVAVETVAKIKMLNERNRYLSPQLDHPVQQIGLVQVETAIESDGERNLCIWVVQVNVREMRVLQTDLHLVLGNLCKIDTEEREQIGELQMVYDT